LIIQALILSYRTGLIIQALSHSYRTGFKIQALAHSYRTGLKKKKESHICEGTRRCRRKESGRPSCSPPLSPMKCRPRPGSSSRWVFSLCPLSLTFKFGMQTKSVPCCCQCCGSVTFWYGSGSADPDFAPDPAFVSDLQKVIFANKLLLAY
jgi:hypothetical protein